LKVQAQVVPQGECQCGCGAATKLSPRTDAVNGYVKGTPRRFLPGHNRLRLDENGDPVDNRETPRLTRKERYRADPGFRAKRLAQGRAAYHANPEPKLERNRRWFKENAGNFDYSIARARARASRRASKRDAFVEAVDALTVLERDDGVCGICGGDVDPTDFHVDHVVALANGGEHSYANVQAAHPACNIKKGKR
jgi:hypothetical protein